MKVLTVKSAEEILNESFLTSDTGAAFAGSSGAYGSLAPENYSVLEGAMMVILAPMLKLCGRRVEVVPSGDGYCYEIVSVIDGRTDSGDIDGSDNIRQSAGCFREYDFPKEMFREEE